MSEKTGGIWSLDVRKNRGEDLLIWMALGSLTVISVIREGRAKGTLSPQNLLRQISLQRSQSMSDLLVVGFFVF